MVMFCWQFSHFFPSSGAGREPGAGELGKSHGVRDQVMAILVSGCHLPQLGNLEVPIPYIRPMF